MFFHSAAQLENMRREEEEKQKSKNSSGLDKNRKGERRRLSVYIGSLYSFARFVPISPWSREPISYMPTESNWFVWIDVSSVDCCYSIPPSLDKSGASAGEEEKS